MNQAFKNPKDQIISIMKRIYEGEMTTLSGGNVSIFDQNDDIWITPKGIDKGKLTLKDIVCIRADGTLEGVHKPSSELAFHQAIYEVRPDLRAVVHAHPPSLVAYSVSGKIPDTRYIAQVHRICGPVAYAPYALTGSDELGENIAKTFSQNVNIVLLENHGVVCGGRTILEAYQRMEALDFCARTLIFANSLDHKSLSLNPDVQKFLGRTRILPEFDSEKPTVNESQMRKNIIEIVQRSCERRLMNSTQGVVSFRLDENSFLIVPDEFDRFSLTVDELILVKERRREKGKPANRDAPLHATIYNLNPKIGSVITAQSPAAMTYAITSVPFESRIIPESFLILREVIKVSQNLYHNEPLEIARLLSNKHPVVLVENECVLISGKTLMEAFDRLEVLEFTARSLLKLSALGEIKPIDENRIRELEKNFIMD